MKLADEIADQLVEAAPLGIVAAKQAIEVGRSLAFDQAELFDERQEFMLEHTEDCDEGIRAFVEKRKPVWKGR
jgi:enoyl-CoA hydratase/carnithine racemase